MNFNNSEIKRGSKVNHITPWLIIFTDDCIKGPKAINICQCNLHMKPLPNSAWAPVGGRTGVISAAALSRKIGGDMNNS